MNKNIQPISYSKYLKMINFDCNTYDNYSLYKHIMAEYKYNIKKLMDLQLDENDKNSLYENLYKNTCNHISYISHSIHTANGLFSINKEK